MELLDRGYIFLKTDNRIPLETRLHLASEAVVMNYFKVNKRKIKTGDFEGVVYTKDKYGCIGCFAGKIDHAEIDLDSNDGVSDGKATLSFIVSSQIRNQHPVLN